MWIFFSLPCLVLSCLTNLSGYPQAFLSIFSATQPHTTAPSRLAEPWQGVNVVRGGCGVLRVFIKIR